METERTIRDIYNLIYGIHSYFIVDEFEDLGFAEVDILVDFGIYPVEVEGVWKHEAHLKCTSNGCGTVNLHWWSQQFDSAEDAVLDLGKIFNDGKFIRDNLSNADRAMFWVGPSYSEEI